MELVKIDHKEYGLEEQKAKNIRDLFKPMLDKMVSLEEQANEVLSLPMEPDTYSKARELRLEYKRTRTGTAAIHKELKAFYLQGGRFVDGLKNAQIMAAQGVEEKLLAIENHEAVEKARKIAALQEKRAKALLKFEIEVVPDNLGELDTVTWNNYLTGTKVNFDKRKAEEKRIHVELIAKEAQAEKERQAQKKEDERVREENRRLAKELLKKEEEQKKADKIRKKKDAEVQKKRDEAAALQRQEEEAKLKLEQKARQKAEEELRERKEEEARQLKEAEDRKQVELNAGDADKVGGLTKNLNHLTTMYTFESDENQKMYKNVGILIGKIITYIQE